LEVRIITAHLKFVIPAIALATLVGSAALADTTPAPASGPDTAKAKSLPIKLEKLPELTVAKGDVAKGEKAFNINCSVCHGTGAVGGEGPQLSHTGIKPGQVAFMVRNPAKIDPNSEMPKLNISDTDLADISAYVASLTKQ
jgi:mono/diheme cytochrome c family protein